MKKNIYLIVIALLLFSSGFVNFVNIQNSILENLKNCSFAYNEMNTQLFDSLKFGILCGITPIVLNVLWNKTKTEKLKLKLLSMFVFITVIGSYIVIKISILNSKNDIEKLEIKNTLSIESLNLTLHFFLAQIIGFFIMYLIFRNKSKTE